VAFSSEHARNFQFSGTEYSYDASEVERFRKQVVAALAEYESSSTPSVADKDEPSQEFAAAQRARQQAVRLAERMLREVMGASGDGIGGLEVWQEAAMMRALAEEELEFASEEARRLPAVAEAERDEMRARYADERVAVRRELQNELQASRAAAGAEADTIRQTANNEAAEVLKRAIAESEARQADAADEIRRLQGRMNVLRTAVADAESRFRRLAALAANELGTLSALADQDITNPEDVAVAAVDLTDDGVTAADETAVADEPTDEVEEYEGPRMPVRDPQAGFYQRRLAGLRDRLEKSGYTPQ
jgi:hypothetical protein